MALTEKQTLARFSAIENDIRELRAGDGAGRKNLRLGDRAPADAPFITSAPSTALPGSTALVAEADSGIVVTGAVVGFDPGSRTPNDLASQADLEALSEEVDALQEGYIFLERHILTTATAISESGVFTPDTRTRAMRVRGWGGGGAGGSVDGNTSQACGAAGGGAGGYFDKFVLGVSGTYSYAVGAKGAKAAAGNNAGGDGGATTFSGTGATLTANGGIGGSGQASGTTGAFSAPGAGGTSSGGDLGGSGASGEAGIRLSGTSSRGGAGAPNNLGGGAAGRLSSGAGVDAVTNGTGGGGANQATNADSAGGDGAPGLICVDEYA